MIDSGIDPKAFASCSEPIENKNKGCPWWNSCRFRDYRDGLNGKRGPVMVGITVINGGNGSGNGCIMPCFDYYFSGAGVRREFAAITKDVIRITAFEGQQIKVQGSFPLHRLPDKNCPDCLRRDCRRRVERTEMVTIEPFQRPGQSLASLAFAEQARAEFAEELEKEQIGDLVTVRARQPEIVDEAKRGK